MRRTKKVVKVGDLKIGGDSPIVVQSMTKTKTRDTKATIRQIRRLEKAGCEMVRLAVVNRDDAAGLKVVKQAVSIPLIADIHFDYRLALAAIAAGVDKVRINPGNIGESWKVYEIIKSAKDSGIPIRIGVNSGSIPQPILKKYGYPEPRAVIEAVRKMVDLFRKKDFDDIVLSAKAADVKDTIAVYQKLSEEFDYPLHIGITEAGLPFRGGIKSAVGLGILLNEGIGDTIRISLTADPTMEVAAAYEILNALGLRRHGPVLISCPTCGRCEVALDKIARSVENRLKRYSNFMKVAVMGCVVNGPGEAREADFGIACGKGRGVVFVKGKEVKRSHENGLVEALFEVIDENIDNR